MYQIIIFSKTTSTPGDFTFVEEWASDSDIDTHFTTAHVQDAFSKAASLLANEPDIQRFSVIG